MSETNEYYFQKDVEGRIEEASALGEARGREIERKIAVERLSKSGLDKELQQYLCEMLFAK